MKQKITEIRVPKKVTETRRGVNGELIKEVKEINGFKEVEVVTGWKRFGHYLIDTFCYYIFTYLIGLTIGIILGFSGTTLYLNETEVKVIDFLLGALILHPLFYTYWEYFFQKTPGKWITRCRVVNEYGESPSFQQILGRSYARSIPFEAFSCFSDRGWHDTMSNTYLVSETHLKELKAIMMIDQIGALQDIHPDENFRPTIT